jgi:ankyrin repeat protein
MTLDEQILTTIEDLIEGATDAHVATENRDISILMSFSEEDLLKQDIDGETVLHYAVSNEDLEICELLTTRNSQIVHIKDIEGKTAFDYAVEYKNKLETHKEICDFLQKFN